MVEIRPGLDHSCHFLVALSSRKVTDHKRMNDSLCESAIYNEAKIVRHKRSNKIHNYAHYWFACLDQDITGCNFLNMIMKKAGLECIK